MGGVGDQCCSRRREWGRIFAQGPGTGWGGGKNHLGRSRGPAGVLGGGGGLWQAISQPSLGGDRYRWRLDRVHLWSRRNGQRKLLPAALRCRFGANDRTL